MPPATRQNGSMRTSAGNHRGTTKLATNKTVMSGTPRTSSMYPMERLRITARRLRRPKAKTMPIGMETVIPKSVRITVKGSPPQLSESIRDRPKRPPCISVKKTKKAAIHPKPSHLAPVRVQNLGQAVTMSMPIIEITATAGLHCNSYG